MEKNKRVIYFVGLFLCILFLAKLMLQGEGTRAITDGSRRYDQDRTPLIEEVSSLSRLIDGQHYLVIEEEIWKLFNRGGDTIAREGFAGKKGLFFYTNESGFVVVSKEENTIYAYDIKGQRLWDQPYSLPIKQLYLDENRIYIHLGSPWGLAQDGEAGASFPQEKIVALNSSNGTYLWEYRLQGETVLTFHSTRGGSIALCTGQLHGREVVHRFHLLDSRGKALSVNQYDQGLIYKMIYLEEGGGWAGLGSSGISYFSSDGVRLWSKQQENQPLGLISIKQDCMVVLEKGGILCFDQQGSLVWERRIRGLGEGSRMVASNNRIAVISHKRIYLLDDRGRIRKTLRLKNQPFDVQVNEDGDVTILENPAGIRTIQGNRIRW